jgi:hypothetical protein
MTSMDPEQAYRAVAGFLEMQWEQRPVPGEFGLFCDYCTFIPGKGTKDPAMWGDWLAAVKKLQTGVDVPDPVRDALTPGALKPLDPDQAYLSMFEFIREYWERVSRPAEIGDLLGQMRYTPGTGTADPEMWKRWLAAIEKAQAGR